MIDNTNPEGGASNKKTVKIDLELISAVKLNKHVVDYRRLSQFHQPAPGGVITPPNFSNDVSVQQYLETVLKA
jgi:hypothetical protein